MKSIIMVSLLTLAAQSANARTWTVLVTEDSGVGSFRDVYARIDPGDTITFAPWLHGKTVELDAELRISKRVTIVGDIDADEKPDVTISGKNSNRIFYVPNGITLKLTGVTLRYGRASGDGGAIYNLGTVNIDRSRLRDNHAGRGGAVYNRGVLVISDSAAQGNIATRDGAVVYNEKIDASLSMVQLTRSGFYHNTAKHQGGVVYNRDGDVNFHDSTFSDNRAVTGPGNTATEENRGSVFYQHGGHTEFRSVTMSGNISNPLTDVEDTYDDSFFGGDGNRTSAKEVQDGNRNRRKNNGGTIYNEGEWGQDEVILINTVIEKSTGRNCGGLAGYNIGPNTWFDDNTCVGHINDRSDYEHQGTDRGDPKLGPLQNNGGLAESHTPYYDDPDHGTSGLIDPTSHTSCAAKDQRGALRIDRINGVHDRACDIGSVEYGAIIPAPPVARTINREAPTGVRLHELQDAMVALSNELHDTNHVPSTLRVTNTNDTGLGSFRAQMGAAKNGDTIVFAPWLFGKTVKLSDDVDVVKNITVDGDINGDGAPDVTIGVNKAASGLPASRMFDVKKSGVLTLSSVHLTGGRARAGGAIFNYGIVIVDHCHIDYNRAASGFGGAIYNRGDVTVSHSTIDHNTADRIGGGIYNGITFDGGGNLRIEASTFEANVSVGNGGAIYNHGGDVHALNTTFTRNEAQVIDGRYSEGTVLYNRGGSATLKNVTMVNNQGANPSNTASNSVMYNQYPSSVPSHDTRDYDVHLINTIIAGVSSDNCEGGHFSSVNSWADDASCGGSNRGEPNIDQLMDNGGPTKTMMPRSDSAVIDGAPSHCPPADQRGAPRSGSQCDIGAVEVGASAPASPAAHDINTVRPDYIREEDPNPAPLPTPDTVETLGARIASLNTRIASLNGIIATLRGQITTLSTTNAALTQSGDAQRVQIAQKTARVVQLEQEASDLRSDLREAQLAVEAAQAQRAAAIERVASLETLRAKDSARIAKLESQLSDHQARIDELEAPDELEVGIGDAGKIEGLRLNGNNVLHDSETRVKVGSETFRLGDTVTEHAHDRKDGTSVSGGQFQGENGIIYWTITSTIVPRTNFHVSRWEFKSDGAFGDASLSIYADLDIGSYAGHNGLVVGGTGHPNRLLITDRTNPAEGVALGLRSLKNASSMGWVGSPDTYHGRNGDVLDPSILTGAYSGWGQFTPDQGVYPGAHGYGPADVAVAMGVKLKSSAKLATFEITLVGAPNGYIE